MSKKLSPYAKNARQKVREIALAAESVVDKYLTAEDPDAVITMYTLAAFVGRDLQIPATMVMGIIRVYLSGRNDLYITKGRHGGIRRLPAGHQLTLPI